VHVEHLYALGTGHDFSILLSHLLDDLSGRICAVDLQAEHELG
jgi:hypothetical protein